MLFSTFLMGSVSVNFNSKDLAFGYLIVNHKIDMAISANNESLLAFIKFVYVLKNLF